MNSKKSFNGNPQPVEKDEVLYPDVPKDTIAEEEIDPTTPDPIEPTDVFGTEEEMIKEIMRIENLNNICRSQLRSLAPAKQQIDGYESNLERNTAMIEYIEYRISLLKKKEMVKNEVP